MTDLAALHQQQAEALAAGRRAEAAGRPVTYIHGRPYADPADAEASESPFPWDIWDDQEGGQPCP